MSLLNKPQKQKPSHFGNFEKILFNQTSDIILIADMNEKIIKYNNKAKEYFHIQDEQVGRHTSISALCKANNIPSPLPKNYHTLLTDKQSFQHEAIINLHANEIQTIDWTITLTSDDSNQAQLFLLGKINSQAIDNISLDNDGKTIEVNNENIISSIPGIIFWKDRNGVYLGCNDYFVKMTGMNSQQDIIGKTDHELCWHKNAKTLSEHDKLVIKNQCSLDFEEELTLANGYQIYTLTTKSPLKDNNGNIIGVIGTSLDITVRKQMEKELKQAQKIAKKNAQKSKLYLKRILAYIPGSVFWKDINGKYIGCNDFVVKMAGLNSDKDIIGKTDYDLCWNDRAEVYRQNDLQVMNTCQPLEAEESVTSSDGKKIVFMACKSPLRGENNEVIGIIGTALDISAKKEAEQLKKEKEILEETIKTMEAIAFSIAHEMRTPLSTISACANGINSHFKTLVNAYDQANKHKLPIKHIRKDRFEIIRNMPREIIIQSRSAFTTIDMLLMNIRQTELKSSDYEPCSIAECTTEALQNYPLREREKKALQFNPANDFTFYGSKLLIQHVLFNLVKNSLYFIHGKPEANITIWFELHEKYNQLHFKDTGQGVPENQLPHIFDRFYSKTHNGTGLGLSFCKMVLDGIGGQIECRSEMGEYTEFILSFPKSPDPSH